MDFREPIHINISIFGWEFVVKRMDDSTKERILMYFCLTRHEIEVGILENLPMKLY